MTGDEELDALLILAFAGELEYIPRNFAYYGRCSCDSCTANAKQLSEQYPILEPLKEKLIEYYNGLTRFVER